MCVEMTKSVAIVIPIYKEELSSEEVTSLRRCLKILYAYPIIFVHPADLDIANYKTLVDSPTLTSIFTSFDESYFADIAGYNKLLLSSFFYRTFSNYDYILIYQLDSFVFTDQLEEWCSRNFDYIGAPWINVNVYQWLFIRDLYPAHFKFFHRLTRGKLLKKVGNGGLSLRRVQACVENLEYFSGAASKWKANEDSFFCHYVKTLNPFFKIPDVNTALEFSFDAHAEKAYERNNFRLPFGCHGWWRNDAPHYPNNEAFWRPIIEKYSIN
jgi:hypothetical protein